MRLDLCQIFLNPIVFRISSRSLGSGGPSHRVAILIGGRSYENDSLRRHNFPIHELPRCRTSVVAGAHRVPALKPNRSRAMDRQTAVCQVLR
jgi:hypothetical protein